MVVDINCFNLRTTIYHLHMVQFFNCLLIESYVMHSKLHSGGDLDYKLIPIYESERFKSICGCLFLVFCVKSTQFSILMFRYDIVVLLCSDG